MRKNLERKLVLHRETLAHLDDGVLLAAAGAATNTYCPTQRISECRACQPPPLTEH